jgi:hypothetical protein
MNADLEKTRAEITAALNVSSGTPFLSRLAACCGERMGSSGLIR